MKKIKTKFLSVLMVCAMVLSFSACDTVKDKNTGSVASSSVSSADNNSKAESNAETDSEGNVIDDSHTTDSEGNIIVTDSNGSRVDDSSNSSNTATDSNGSSVDNSSNTATDSNGSRVDNSSNATTNKNSSNADSTSKAGGNTSIPATKDPFTLTVSNAKGSAGDTVTVNVVVADNPGISGMLVEIDYNKDVLQITDNGFDKGEMIRDADAFMGNNGVYPNKVVWANTTDILDNGNVLVLEFKIAKNAPEGDYEVNIIEDTVDICNANYKQLYPSTNAGTITVE